MAIVRRIVPKWIKNQKKPSRSQKSSVLGWSFKFKGVKEIKCSVLTSVIYIRSVPTSWSDKWQKGFWRKLLTGKSQTGAKPDPEKKAVMHGMGIWDHFYHGSIFSQLCSCLQISYTTFHTLHFLFLGLPFHFSSQSNLASTFSTQPPMLSL